MTLFIIWASNHDTAAFRNARAMFAAIDPSAKIFHRNADAYSGKGDVEKCDGVFVQDGYINIQRDFIEAGIPVHVAGKVDTALSGAPLNILSIESPIEFLEKELANENRRSAGNEAGQDAGTDSPEEGSEDPALAGVQTPEAGKEGVGMGNVNLLHVARRRDKQGGKKTRR